MFGQLYELMNMLVIKNFIQNNSGKNLKVGNTLVLQILCTLLTKKAVELRYYGYLVSLVWYSALINK